jgi:D-alanyl-D-alanine carboxypeptidase
VKPLMSGGRILLATVAFALLGLVVASSATATRLETAPDSRLQHRVESIVDSKGGPPGIAMLISRGRRKEFFSAGTAGGGLAPAPGLHFRIASVSKGFNAYLAAKLVGFGLPFETTLGRWIPGTLPAGEAVTMRQLLQHTSGLPEYIRAPAFVEQLTADPARYFAPTELTAFVRDEPLEFAPGSRYHYSDTDNIAAALIMETATGSPYEKLLGQFVLGHLRMRDTSLPVTATMPRPFMHGYDVEPGKKPEDVSELINPAGAWASGGIVSTPLDLSYFVRSYARTMLLKTKGLEGRFRPGSSSPPGPGKNFAGLGIFRYRTDCGTVYGHTGSFPGYRVFIAASADGSRSVVFVANAQIVPGSGSQKVAKAITNVQAAAVCRALT